MYIHTYYPDIFDNTCYCVPRCGLTTYLGPMLDLHHRPHFCMPTATKKNSLQLHSTTVHLMARPPILRTVCIYTVQHLATKKDRMLSWRFHI